MAMLFVSLGGRETNSPRMEGQGRWKAGRVHKCFCRCGKEVRGGLGALQVQGLQLPCWAGLTTREEDRLASQLASRLTGKWAAEEKSRCSFTNKRCAPVERPSCPSDSSRGSGLMGWGAVPPTAFSWSLTPEERGGRGGAQSPLFCLWSTSGPDKPLYSRMSQQGEDTEVSGPNWGLWK